MDGKLNISSKRERDRERERKRVIETFNNTGARTNLTSTRMVNTHHNSSTQLRSITLAKKHR